MTNRLWQKSWLETRWRFLIGLALALCSGAATVLIYPRVLALVPLVQPTGGGEIGERVREAASLTRDYRGYIWAHWFRQNLAEVAMLFAILLGTADLISQSRGAIFTMSLPIRRARVAGVRAIVGLAELFVLVLASSVVIPLLSPAIGRSYGALDTLIHSGCLFLVASAFFTLAFWLSTIFGDPWRPLVIALAVALVLSVVGHARVMSAESWFRTGHVPWIGLLIVAAVSAAFYIAALMNIRRRDF